MNQTLTEHLKRLNPTGVEWDDMTEQQKEELRMQWDKVVSQPENLACSCPRTGCRNNRNCKFCVSLHRYYDGLADCLRIVDDKLEDGIPYEKRHNLHKYTSAQATSREDYAAFSAAREPDPVELRKEIDEYHRIVHDPKNIACNCPRTDCWYHNNCVKCIALHRYYDGFPNCCQPIGDKIDEAIQAYKLEQGGNP